MRIKWPTNSAKLTVYLKIVDRAYIYDADVQPELIAYKEGQKIQILQENLWESFMKEAKL
jgi:predicted ABC-type ATPase